MDWRDGMDINSDIESDIWVIRFAYTPFQPNAILLYVVTRAVDDYFS